AARSHRATPWLWAGVAACALALAATFLPLRLPGPPDPDGPPDLERAESDPLPPSQAPEVALAPDLVLLSHPDLEQLANAEDAVVVDELGLYAWYAARLSRDARSRGGEGDGGRCTSLAAAGGGAGVLPASGRGDRDAATAGAVAHGDAAARSAPAVAGACAVAAS